MPIFYAVMCTNTLYLVIQLCFHEPGLQVAYLTQYTGLIKAFTLKMPKQFYIRIIWVYPVVYC
jgi:hypothetical protein